MGERIVKKRALELFQARSSVLRLLQADGSLVTLARWGHLQEASEVSAVLPAGIGPSGRAIVEGRAVASSDVFSDPAIAMTAEVAVDHAVRAGDAAVLAVPLRARGRTIGTLVLGDVSGRVFSDAERGVLQAFGDQAALALENAQLYEQNRRQVDELSVLLELSQAVTGQLDRTALLRAIHTQALRIIGAANATIVLRDQERGDLEVVLRVVDGVPDTRTPLRYPALGVGLMSIVLETGRAVRTDGYHDECVRRGVAPIDTVPDAQYWLGVPMTTGEMVIGMLALHRPTRAFAEADERLLSSIGHLAALALRSAQLFEELNAGLRRAGVGAGPARADREAPRARRDGLGGGARLQQPARVRIRGCAQLTLQRLQDPQLRKWLQVIERSALDGAQTVRRLQEFDADPSRPAVRGGRSQRDRARRSRDHPVALARGDA